MDIIVGLSITALLWRRRSPRTLSFVIWGSVALMQESGGLFVGFFTDPHSDASAIIRSGCPTVVLLLVAAGLLVTSVFFLFFILPILGFRIGDTKMKGLICSSGIIAFMFLGLLYCLIFNPGRVLTRLIMFGSFLAMIILIVTIAGKVLPTVNRISPYKHKPITWDAVVLSLSLFFAVLLAGLLFFN